MVPDEVLGQVGTLRKRLIAAQTINALCHGLSGIPGVQVAGDIWQIRGLTGNVTQCSTVNDVWDAVLRAPSTSLHREQLLHRMHALLHAPTAGDTDPAQNVINAGWHQARNLFADAI
ncbi:hypothetical protein [Arthrobacter sp. H5]|uniref:hypothetical protein n=1 Tax=Arthrobacter sp. H5 TaxID=1267973 RepID=UPI0004896B52|nr:hypothetical protein [Arthrobacter sp. H5]